MRVMTKMFVLAASITSFMLFADMSYTDNGGRTWRYADNDDGSITITGIRLQSTSAITIPQFLNGRHVTRIGNDAFRDNNMITGVTIPGCIVGIGDCAFAGCANLEKLTILEGVKAIGGSDAFRWCARLKAITLPKSLTFIRQRAFKNTDTNKRVNVDSIEHWMSIGFGTGGSNPLCHGDSYLCVNGVAIVDLKIPDGTTEVKGCAFCGYSLLKSVSIPGSVRRIGSEAFAYMKGAHILFASDIGTVEIAGGAFHDSSPDCRIEVSAKPGCVFAGWEDGHGNAINSSDLIHQSNQGRIVVTPKWKPVVRRSYSQWQGGNGNSAGETLESSEADALLRKKSRPCWKCHGKGTVLKTVRETCDACNGAKVITTKVTLTDKHDWWYGSVRKESMNTRGCPKCNRTGSVSIKREVECPTCHGTGDR